MKRIIMATNNKGKIEELKKMLSEFEIISQKEAGIEDLNVDENGMTFEENAIIKANSIKELVSDAIIIAEDSGFMIEALGGYPGTKTKRAAGEELDKDVTDEERNNFYVEKMKNIENKKAVWQTAICMIDGEKQVTFIGEVEGEISKEVIGDNGFGFDPIFYIPEVGKTLAQMTYEEKNEYSARNRAAQKLVTYLR